MNDLTSRDLLSCSELRHALQDALNVPVGPYEIRDLNKTISRRSPST
jgi:hypothetical protein